MTTAAGGPPRRNLRGTSRWRRAPGRRSKRSKARRPLKRRGQGRRAAAYDNGAIASAKVAVDMASDEGGAMERGIGGGEEDTVESEALDLIRTDSVKDEMGEMPRSPIVNKEDEKNKDGKPGAADGWVHVIQDESEDACEEHQELETESSAEGDNKEQQARNSNKVKARDGDMNESGPIKDDGMVPTPAEEDEAQADTSDHDVEEVGTTEEKKEKDAGAKVDGGSENVGVNSKENRSRELFTLNVEEGTRDLDGKGNQLDHWPRIAAMLCFISLALLFGLFTNTKQVGDSALQTQQQTEREIQLDSSELRTRELDQSQSSSKVIETSHSKRNLAFVKKVDDELKPEANKTQVKGSVQIQSSGVITEKAPTSSLDSDKVPKSAQRPKEPEIHPDHSEPHAQENVDNQSSSVVLETIESSEPLAQENVNIQNSSIVPDTFDIKENSPIVREVGNETNTEAVREQEEESQEDQSSETGSNAVNPITAQNLTSVKGIEIKQEPKQNPIVPTSSLVHETTKNTGEGKSRGYDNDLEDEPEVSICSPAIWGSGSTPSFIAKSIAHGPINEESDIIKTVAAQRISHIKQRILLEIWNAQLFMRENGAHFVAEEEAIDAVLNFVENN